MVYLPAGCHQKQHIAIKGGVRLCQAQGSNYRLLQDGFTLCLALTAITLLLLILLNPHHSLHLIILSPITAVCYTFSMKYDIP